MWSFFTRPCSTRLCSDQLAAVFVASQTEKSALWLTNYVMSMFEQFFLMSLLYFLNFHFAAFQILMPIGGRPLKGHRSWAARQRNNNDKEEVGSKQNNCSQTILRTPTPEPSTDILQKRFQNKMHFCSTSCVIFVLLPVGNPWAFLLF